MPIAEFVGGPMDGKTMEVRETTVTVVIPVLAEHLAAVPADEFAGTHPDHPSWVYDDATREWRPLHIGQIEYRRGVDGRFYSDAVTDAE